MKRERRQPALEEMPAWVSQGRYTGAVEAACR